MKKLSRIDSSIFETAFIIMKYFPARKHSDS